MLKKIRGNVQKDSRECSRRFRGMFENIPGNVKEDSGESTFWFIAWNVACFLIKFC